MVEELRGEGLPRLGRLVVFAHGVLDPGVELGEQFKPEEPEEGVVQVAERSVDHRAELAVRQERPGQLQRPAIEDLLQLPLRAVLRLDPRPCFVQLGSVPGPPHGDGFGLLSHRQFNADLGSDIGTVEVAPALLPVTGSPPLPAGVAPRDRGFGGLSEARLAGPVRPGDDYEAGPRRQVERGSGPDTAPAGRGDGTELDGTGPPPAAPDLLR
ncbi:hypothetical protein GCM10028832_02300 [Streptomyces sparsus]